MDSNTGVESINRSFQVQTHSVCIFPISIWRSSFSQYICLAKSKVDDEQYPFSTPCTVNPRVSRYNPIAARFDFLTCSETYDALYIVAMASSVAAPKLVRVQAA